MKKILQTLALGVVIAAIFYGAVSFQQLSFNPVLWNPFARFNVALLGALCLIGGLILGILRNQE